MIASSTRLPSAAQALFANPPKTLPEAREVLAAISAHAKAIGAADVATKAAAVSPKTLPQAREALDEFKVMLGAAHNSRTAPSSSPGTSEMAENPYAEKVAQLHQREAARAAAIADGKVPAAIARLAADRGIEIPKPQATDAEILEIYNGLTGSQRKAFLEQHRDALWREHSRRQRAKAARS